MPENEMDLALEMLSQDMGLDYHRGDIAECIACESRGQRVDKMIDNYFRFMNLYHLMWDPLTGKHRPHVKKYNCHTWELLA